MKMAKRKMMKMMVSLYHMGICQRMRVVMMNVEERMSVEMLNREVKWHMPKQ